MHPLPWPRSKKWGGKKERQKKLPAWGCGSVIRRGRIEVRGSSVQRHQGARGRPLLLPAPPERVELLGLSPAGGEMKSQSVYPASLLKGVGYWQKFQILTVGTKLFMLQTFEWLPSPPLFPHNSRWASFQDRLCTQPASQKAAWHFLRLTCKAKASG